METKKMNSRSNRRFLSAFQLPLTIILLIMVFSHPFPVAATDDPVRLKMRSGFERSYALEKEKRYTEAMNALQTLNMPNDYAVNLRLGWLAHHAAQYAQAITYYRTSQRLNPKATEPLWGLLLPLNAQENWEEAEKVYVSILALDPKNSSANYHLGLIYRYHGWGTVRLGYQQQVRETPFYSFRAVAPDQFPLTTTHQKHTNHFLNLTLSWKLKK